MNLMTGYIIEWVGELCNLIGQLLCENFSLTCTRYRDSYRNCENDINDTPFVYPSSQMRTLVSALYLIKLDASSTFLLQIDLQSWYM